MLMTGNSEIPTSDLEKQVKISLKNVYKIFGDHPEKAMSLLRSGKDKSEIHKETGCTIGVNDASFDVMDGEIFVIMGLSGSGNLLCFGFSIA